MSYLPATWSAITVSLLVAGKKWTLSPWARNRFWYSATKKPAESSAGTTATLRSVFSRPGAFAAPPPLEQPAASASAASVTKSALARTRLVVISSPFLVNEDGTAHGRYNPG